MNAPGKFVKKTLKEEENENIHQHPPELISVNWDKKYLLKTGKFAIAKTSSYLNG